MSNRPTEEEFFTYFDTLSNWGRWGDDDELGTLNLITPAKRIAAAELVRTGITVSCAWDIGGTPPADQPAGPPDRRMLGTGENAPEKGAGGAGEYIGLVYHGHTVTHLDGLSHMFWNGKMYNGKPANAVTTDGGATQHAITAVHNGVFTRGVLLDAAKIRGVDWLQPGDPVYPADLEACEVQQGVIVSEGDVIMLRTGYGRRSRENGPDDVAKVGRPGWHASCLPWFHERGVAVIAADTAQDAIPSGYPNVRNPIHSVAICAMGLWLLDNCDLEALATMCTDLGRWEFLFTLAPLRWVGATGSPANPIATF